MECKSLAAGGSKQDTDAHGLSEISTDEIYYNSSMPKNIFKTILKRWISRILEDVLFMESRNIERARQILALQETALFVEANLSQIPSFESRYELYRYLARYVPQAGSGLMCEFGVAGGKSIRFLAKLFPERTIYGFDSFEGLPENWANLPKGAYKQPVPKVPSNVVLIQGWFSDSLPDFLQKHPETFDFVHIDCDLYSSTKTVFEHCRDRIRAGTILCFDEFFNYPGWKEGEYRAFFEFIAQTSHSFEYLAYNRRGTQVALRIVA
ncbi:MAG: class I SAM-dependent methyltransferase [Chloroflexi bacterium]|nr:class I SAM-dependent methyltransferase [Chloroflexota bacterium]